MSAREPGVPGASRRATASPGGVPGRDGRSRTPRGARPPRPSRSARRGPALRPGNGDGAGAGVGGGPRARIARGRAGGAPAWRRGIDPILFEVLRNALAGITTEMGLALKKSAYSTNIKAREDMSCALFDRELRIASQSFGQGNHLPALAFMVPTVLREYGVEHLRPGDQIAMNDPHRGSIHLNELLFVAPVFEPRPGGRLFGFVANIAHHTDVGGRAAASICIATEIFQEGVIIPPIRLVAGGRVDEEKLRFFLANVRTPRQNAGDVRAQIAANVIGVRRLGELLARYGAARLARYIRALQDYTEERTRRALRRIARGTVAAETCLDDDGVTGEPIPLRAAVTIGDGEATMDVRDAPPQRLTSMNCTFVSTYASFAYVIKALLDQDIPINDGFYRPIRVRTTPGTIFDARHPAPVVGAAEVGIRLCDVLFLAFARLLPDRVVAASKGIICYIGFGGTSPRTGQYYCFVETVAGGGGARADRDGMDAVQAHIQNTENTPIEEAELAFPFRVLRYELIPDSEGAGRLRGGLGVRRDYLFPDHAVDLTLLSDRTKFPPWGLFGGDAAQPAAYLLAPGPGERVLPSKITTTLPPGTVLSVRTPGGGGYGPARERDPEAVRRDVRDGKVGLARAREAYRVALDPAALTLDPEATRRLREAPP
jgi:N-methylhydantoinase B